MEDGRRHHVHLLGVGIDRLPVERQPVGDHLVTDPDRLGQPGGTTGEQHQGGVPAIPDRGRCLAGGGGRIEQVIHTQHRPVDSWAQALDEPRAGHADPGADLFGELGQLTGGQVGIHLGGGRAQARRTVEGGHRQDAPDVDQRHPVARPHPGGRQHCRRPSDVGLELPIGGRAALDRQGDPVGRRVERGIGGVSDVHPRQTPQWMPAAPVVPAVCVMGAVTRPRTAAVCSATGRGARVPRASMIRAG